MKKASKKEILDSYRLMLPYGFQKKVAERLGVSTVAVSQFLSGKNRSKRIENEIRIIISELQQNRADVLKSLGLYND